jgi:hypothetical protein
MYIAKHSWGKENEDWPLQHDHNQQQNLQS